MKYEFKGPPGPYKTDTEHGTHKGREIVRCYLRTDNGSAPDGMEYPLASGHGNLSELFAPNDQAIASFQLFAASPLLLSALIKAVEYIDSENEGYNEYHIPDWYHEAKAAIEQALNLSPVNTQS